MKFLVRLVRRYLESGATQYGGMIGFSLLISLIPLTLGLLSLFGLVERDQKQLFAVRQIIVEIFPPDLHGPVRQALRVAGQHASTIILISVVGLFWFSSGLFSTTGFALNQIHGFPNRSFWRQRLQGLSLAVALMGATTAAVAADLAVHLFALPPILGLIGVWIALSALILFMYRRAPGRMLLRSQLWPGAAVAALVIVLGGYGLSLGTKLTFHLATDTRFFAQVFGLAAWVYFIAQAILFGAVLNRCLIEERELQVVREVTAPEPARG